MAKYWFRQKRFGFGATPTSWQGWVLTIGAILLAAGVVLGGPAIRDNVLRALWMSLGIAGVGVPYSLLAWTKTEGGWRSSGD